MNNKIKKDVAAIHFLKCQFVFAYGHMSIARGSKAAWVMLLYAIHTVSPKASQTAV